MKTCVVWFFLFCVVSASLMVAADEAVPLSVKYQTVAQDGTCQPADASAIFVRRIDLPGCNPTFNGNPMGYDSWTVACDAEEETDWDITWFNNTLTCAGTPVETAVQTAGCETNDKQETEAFFCSPAFLENSGIAFDQFTLKLDLFRDDACSETEFFMSQYLIPNQCLVDSDTESSMFMPDATSNTGTARRFNSNDCSGSPTDTTIPVDVACFPYSDDPNTNEVLAWAKITDIAADLEADLPALPSMPPSMSPSKMMPTSSSVKNASNGMGKFMGVLIFSVLTSIGLL